MYIENKTKIDVYVEIQNLNKTMKVKSSIKKRSAGDKIVRRKGRLYRINKTNPRHKARQ